MSKFTEDDKRKVNGQFESIKNGKFNQHDTATVLNNVDEILEKGSTGPLAGFFDDIKTMCQMVKAWAKKEYKEIPIKTIGMIILTLVYVFSPVDIIPDFIPVVGLLDDSAMVALCVGAAKSDINDFRRWAASHKNLLK